MKKLLLTLLVLSTAQIAAAQNRDVVVANNPIRGADPKEYLKNIKLPPGFKIDLYAENLESARSMAFGEEGTLFVGTRLRRHRDRAKRVVGKIYAILDKNNDQKADEVITIAEGLNWANGVAFKDGSLYVAEINRILRYDNIEANLTSPPEPVVIKDDFPTQTHHGWKFIRFGPDGKLYVPVGAPCNICEREEPIFASITRMNPDGSDREIFAKGIRNTVGFDWHPESKELWFTENGRDEMGEDMPPEELNYAPKAGLHFGFPYRYGKTIVDTTFQTDLKESDFQPATVEIPAHVAALGMRFYTGDSFPEEYHNQIIIAEHGSWNRSKPQGYRVSMVTLDGNRPVEYKLFATGWLLEEGYWGRPVDIELMTDGSILVSDDFANCIYRISYEKS